MGRQPLLQWLTLWPPAVNQSNQPSKPVLSVIWRTFLSTNSCSCVDQASLATLNKTTRRPFLWRTQNVMDVACHSLHTTHTHTHTHTHTQTHTHTLANSPSRSELSFEFTCKFTPRHTLAPNIIAELHSLAIIINTMSTHIHTHRYTDIYTWEQEERTWQTHRISLRVCCPPSYFLIRLFHLVFLSQQAKLANLTVKFNYNHMNFSSDMKKLREEEEK